VALRITIAPQTNTPRSETHDTRACKGLGRVLGQLGRRDVERVGRVERGVANDLAAGRALHVHSRARTLVGVVAVVEALLALVVGRRARLASAIRRTREDGTQRASEVLQ